MADQSATGGAEPAIVVRDAPERGRYELLVDGALAGISEYHAEDGMITFVHTEVDPAYEGRGLGSKLARGVLDDARARGLKVIPECPFIRVFIRRHREYADLLIPRRSSR